ISPNNAVDIWQKASSKLAFYLVVIAEVSQRNFLQNFCSAVYFLFVLHVLYIWTRHEPQKSTLFLWQVSKVPRQVANSDCRRCDELLQQPSYWYVN
ncbi:TPA: hypothetical protein ACGOYO_001470, partial [Streptococcus suis]